MSVLKVLIAFLQSYREQLSWYGALVDYRNSINHAGYNQPISPRKFALRLGEILQASKPLFIEFARLSAHLPKDQSIRTSDE